MLKNRRKRAVLLALIAFFCSASYLAVDWKRLGGGILAFFKDKHDPMVASAGHRASGRSATDYIAAGDGTRAQPASLLHAAAISRRRHSADGGAGAAGHPADDDLFKYGDPAAGGIPPGSFIVATNDTPTGGAPGVPEAGGGPAIGGGESGGGVTSPAPAPTGGSGDGGIIGSGKAPTSSPPAATPPAGSAPAPAPGSPAPAPTQSGTIDDPGAPPLSSPPPVSSVPEASSLTMMGLGTLFLAVAAARRRRNG